MTTPLSTEPGPEVHEPAPPPADRAALRRRIRAMTIWAVTFTAAWLFIGLPTDPLYAFFWLWAATVAWRSELPWRRHLAFARDWLPVVLLLAVYNLSRGFADNGAQPHVRELIDADVWMFGRLTGGMTPTGWLQERLYDPGVVHWWDVLVSWIYFSHFVAALAAAVVLWLRSRPRWAAFMRRWFVLCAAGLVTYFLYPAAPPWWASLYGYLAEPVARISTNGWKAVGLHGAGNMLNVGQAAANPVAAMPSLHTAFALFVVVFFLPSVRRRWWPLMLAYPLAMTFTLVYSGEHYIIDVLVGWVYVGAVFLVVGLGERWWRARTAGADAAVGPPAGADAPAPADAAAGPPGGTASPGAAKP